MRQAFAALEVSVVTPLAASCAHPDNEKARAGRGHGTSSRDEADQGVATAAAASARPPPVASSPRLSVTTWFVRMSNT
jgi:hypothetical protein